MQGEESHITYVGMETKLDSDPEVMLWQELLQLILSSRPSNCCLPPAGWLPF